MKSQRATVQCLFLTWAICSCELKQNQKNYTSSLIFWILRSSESLIVFLCILTGHWNSYKAYRVKFTVLAHNRVNGLRYPVLSLDRWEEYISKPTGERGTMIYGYHYCDFVPLDAFNPVASGSDSSISLSPQATWWMCMVPCSAVLGLYFTAASYPHEMERWCSFWIIVFQFIVQLDFIVRAMTPTSGSRVTCSFPKRCLKYAQSRGLNSTPLALFSLRSENWIWMTKGCAKQTVNSWEQKVSLSSQEVGIVGDREKRKWFFAPWVIKLWNPFPQVAEAKSLTDPKAMAIYVVIRNKKSSNWLQQLFWEAY